MQLLFLLALAFVALPCHGHRVQKLIDRRDGYYISGLSSEARPATKNRGSDLATLLFAMNGARQSHNGLLGRSFIRQMRPRGRPILQLTEETGLWEEYQAYRKQKEAELASTASAPTSTATTQVSDALTSANQVEGKSLPTILKEQDTFPIVRAARVSLPLAVIIGLTAGSALYNGDFGEAPKAPGVPSVPAVKPFEAAPPVVRRVISEQEVKQLFTLWNNALLTGNSDNVAKRYAKNAVLLPTVSDMPRTTYAGIKDYFDHFLELKPEGRIVESYVYIGDNWCNDVGLYEFKKGTDGSIVRARYSFVYIFEDGEWKISHHHSSLMPEPLLAKARPAQVISEQEVKQLFSLWNDALLTGSSDAVTKRYAKNAVLLPTVSDVPRTSYAGIKDYFDHFLELKPEGRIVESYVSIGDNWCKDVGIYEFKKGTDGSIVRARYSFIYVFEDGEWKISHHHSSLMPEELLAKAKTA